MAAGGAAAKGTALAVGVVVADPDCDGDVVGETHEPGVVLLVGSAGLARDIGGEPGDCARRAARQHALQHGLELIERGAVDRIDRHRPRLIMAIDRLPVALNGIHDVRGRPDAFIRNRGKKGGEIDRPHRLGTEHERIVAQTLAINLRFQRKIAETAETGFGFAFDAAIEQVDSRKIARVLERPPQGQGMARASVVVSWGPIAFAASTAVADRRQRDEFVHHQCIGLQALTKRGEVA